MRTINILSLVQAKESLESGNYKSFLNYHGIDISDAEVDDLNVFVELLINQTDSKSLLNSFYVSYKIPQIGKEFDLLRFGTDSIINIELKSKCDEDKIKAQLIRNEYYLSYLNTNIFNYCFSSDSGQLYILESGEIRQTSFLALIEHLMGQKVEQVKDVDAKFNPSNYLVSPFNNTKKFLENKYFLTHQQEEIKKLTLKTLEDTKEPGFVSISGSAGTGKTLLVYDLVKTVKKSGKKPLIIHCGTLNKGQEELRAADWDIIPIKNIKNYKVHDYDAVFIDEGQRIWRPQLEDLKKEIIKYNRNMIFSFDRSQTLARWEDKSGVDQILDGLGGLISYKLSEKIRTNKEIAFFIRSLFNKTKDLEYVNGNNIEINYFNSLNDAKDYIETLKDQNWEVLRFTPSQHDEEHHKEYAAYWQETSHRIIGQEFDHVAVIIDRNFSYDEGSGDLIYMAYSYYAPVKMLFQNITRARKKLNLIIIDNEVLLERCIKILRS